MRRFRAFFLRFAGLFKRQDYDRDFSAEMESHLQMHIEDNLRAGMTAAGARREALMKLGGVEQTKENYRQQRGVPLVEPFLQDLRYAFRMLSKSPGFTTVAVLTLALGIGANTAIFSVVNGVMLKPLPYRQPDRLVSLFLHGPGLDRGSMGAADFLALEERQQVFEHVSAFSPSSVDSRLQDSAVLKWFLGHLSHRTSFPFLAFCPFWAARFCLRKADPGEIFPLS